MFKEIFRHELAHWARQPVVYIFGFILFALAFLTMWGMASEGGEGPTPEILNSPYRINFMSNYLSLLMLFVLPAIMGGALFRDYRSRMYTLLYAYPITKRGYLAAKFLSAWIVTAAVISSLSLGFMLGTQMPGVQPNVLAPFSWAPYLQLLLIFQWPNLLVFGLLIFLIIIHSRNIYLAFIAIILLVVLQQIVGLVFTGENGAWLAALLDPVGDRAVKYVVRYWPQAQRDTQLIPLQGIILYNRLLWLGIGMVLGGWAYRSFAFKQFASARKQSGGTDSLNNMLPRRSEKSMQLPAFTLGFGKRASLRNAWHISQQEARYIIWSWPFAALLVAGFMVVYLQQQQMNPEYGFAILPTTARMLRIPLFIFSLVINLITFLYAGVLIHRGNMTRMGPLLDICPQPNWVFLLGRWGGIVKVQIVLLGLVMIGGMLAQTFYGYTHYELGHYLFELFGLHLIHFVIWACMAVFVHSLFNNLYLGFFALLLIPIGLIGQNTVADFLQWPFLKEALTQFNAVQGVVVGFDYSDLNGYGSILPVYAVYKTYWAIAGIGLLMLGLAAWKRELSFSFRERSSIFASRLRSRLGWMLLTTLVAFLSLGSFIYYQTHFVSRTHFSGEKVDALLAVQELEFGYLEQIPQPRLAAATIKMDIYPAHQDYHASGKLSFVNKNAFPLDTIFVFRSLKDSVKFELKTPYTQLVSAADIRLDVFRLQAPLAPGDTLELEFTAQNYANSLFHHNSRILTNGTYMTDHILPKMEWRDARVNGQKKRARYGLKPGKNPAPMPEDSSKLGYAYFRNNTDRIAYETVISTSREQRGFSMGTLIREWEEGERQYFHYKSQGLMPNTISWISGRYARKTDSIPGHKIEIYHHPDHGHNYPNLLKGIKSSLAAGNTWYSPLEHPVLRLIEFPLTEGTHATLNGNLIPFSEALFLCDVDEEANEVFDMPFFIAAHELAHYWWGHRIDPANVRGSKLLTEAMAEYHAAKLIEQEFGQEKVRTFLGNMHRTYLRQRASSGEEYPLIYTKAEQDFLNYRKGGLAMYALSSYMGADSFHQALAAYEATRRFAEPPFPNSLDFVEYLRNMMPDSLAHLPSDLFEHITLYDLRIEGAETQAKGEGYRTRLDLRLLKYRNTAHGARDFSGKDKAWSAANGEQSLPLQEYVQLSLYGPDQADGSATLLKTIEVAVYEITSSVTISSEMQPRYVIADPYYRMIDPERTDNQWNFD